MMSRFVIRRCRFTSFLCPLIGGLLVYIVWRLVFHREQGFVFNTDIKERFWQREINTSLTETNMVLDDNVSSKQYDLRIIVMVFSRAHSLHRLLHSINSAEYYNDQIKLEVWIDRSKNGTVDETVKKTALDFKFHHGEYSVHAHPTHVGIYGQWLNTWRPVENSSEIALLLEDDIEVSPLFYKYLKTVHKKYDDYPNINGFSLQGYSGTLSLFPKGDIKAPYEHQVILYPILGAWGFSPNKKNWMEFLKWVRPAMKEGTVKPYVPGTITTYWYIFGKGDQMWSMWHIYYAWLHDERTLYVNLKDHEGFTANWREEGLHFKNGGVGKPSNPLVTNWKSEFDNLPDSPVEVNLDSEVINHV